MDLTKLTIVEAHKGLIENKFTSVELTKAFLDKIKKEDDKINAFITITEDIALETAKEVDDMIKRGENIPMLAGLPVAIKDNIQIEGVKTTCASKILENYVGAYDATVIKKLKEQKAVFIGKTNLDEFAMGASTENSAFFPTKNPKDKSRVAGGSSGGSAAAVAADMCVYALGSDTGGSIRQPASFCGVTGLKPTYGAVSRYGLVAFASSLDQIGPITKNAEDAKIVLEAICGKDEKDSTSVDFSFKEDKETKEITAGIPKEYFAEGIEPEVKGIVEEAIEKFKKLGIKTKSISLPNIKYAIPTYYLVCTSEASANLARFDGIRYGLSKQDGNKLIDVYTDSKAEGFGAEVKRRIMLGTYALSSGYYDAYYLKAQQVRTLIKEDFEKAFNQSADGVDVIFSPTTPTPAFKIGEKTQDPLAMYLGDIYTVSVNLAGVPAISIPVGETKDGLPVGLQIIGKHFEDNKILALAKLYGF